MVVRDWSWKCLSVYQYEKYLPMIGHHKQNEVNFYNSMEINHHILSNKSIIELHETDEQTVFLNCYVRIPCGTSLFTFVINSNLKPSKPDSK